MKRVLPGLFVLLCAGAAAAQAHRFPLDPNHCANVPGGTCYVTAYFDLNGGGGVTDWGCGGDSYDGHRGTDYGVGSWGGMDQGVDVLASAPGTVDSAHDGEFDRCSTADCGDGNYVIVTHDDGKRTLYWHLKQGSVAVSIGQRVECGQRLGQVGSSGRSTGPHLHFQVNVGGAADDPYASPGGCGGPTSYWVDQGGYGGLPGACCEGGCTVPPLDDAQYVGQSPDDDGHFQPGQRFPLTFRVRNTGNTTWTREERILLTRDGDEPGAPQQGGLEQIELQPGEAVPPGGEAAFTFEVTAADAPGGPYRAWYRMDRFGTARFGGRFYLQHFVDPPIDPDADLDGVTVGQGDCLDDDPSVRPGAAESCDGRDEDCDGATDEEVPSLPCSSACGAGVQLCVSGAYAACDAPAAGIELCNGLDDDCSGVIDDVPGGCAPSPEKPALASGAAAEAEHAAPIALEGGCASAGGAAGSGFFGLLGALVCTTRRRRASLRAGAAPR